jgi:hypothetical protein
MMGRTCRSDEIWDRNSGANIGITCEWRRANEPINATSVKFDFRATGQLLTVQELPRAGWSCKGLHCDFGAELPSEVLSSKLRRCDTRMARSFT